MSFDDTRSRWRYSAAFNDLLGRYAPPSPKALLEWGAGDSTLQFHLLAQVSDAELLLSVDEHAAYHHAVTRGIADQRVLRTASVALHGPEGVGYEPDRYYYTTCPIAEDRHFDVILVDGRARSECLLVAALLASPDALILLDDCRRIRYSAAQFFFDTVKVNIKTAALRRKPEFAPWFDGFLDYVKQRGTANGIAPPRFDPWPALPELSSVERASLAEIVGRLSPGAGARVLEWGTPESTAVLCASIDAPSKYLSVGHTRRGLLSLGTLARRYTGLTLVDASLRGDVQDHSRDPNFHYSMAPFVERERFDFVYVGGLRRNECLLSTSLLLAEGGRVIVRDGALPHYAPGTFLFEVESQEGVFTVLRGRKGLDELLAGYLDGLGEAELTATVTAPADAKERDAEEHYLRGFLDGLGPA